jgi:2-oxoisovalerate dehydrogenase E1 component
MMETLKKTKTSKGLEESLLLKAFELMATAKTMAHWYEEHFKMVSKYVHSTSRGHEAIQIATGLLLQPQDFAFPYYRDESMLLAIGMKPYDLMLQLMAKRDDPFSGGRSYYSHPSLREEDKPKIPHQSSATGMQAIPATGAAMGLKYRLEMGLKNWNAKENPIVLCSLGDASITEGEVAEAFQMASLKNLPILFLVQDNDWDISAYADEFRSQDASEYARGFKNLEISTIDGTDFELCYQTLQTVLGKLRQKGSKPQLVHAKVPLLNHHTSGVRKDWYRHDLQEAEKRDPFPKFKNALLKKGISETLLIEIESEVRYRVERDFEKAQLAEDPRPEDLFQHAFAPSPVLEEKGNREGKKVREVMVDQALHAIEELMAEHKECVLYGQDVGERLGGVFREAATLAQKFGKDRVFNTPIQEAFIVGSTVGMSAVGLKPIVEVQFADYIWPGLNQLFTEVSRSCYLSNGKWPVSMILRVPIGAYGSGGPYHSSSVESVVCNIKGIKIAYPSTGADLKGLMKAAFKEPNPVVIFEHKGLYWSKNQGTERAKNFEPDSEYIIPFGKAKLVQSANSDLAHSGNTITVITYGMGVHWAFQASEGMEEQVEILDLRTLYPLDEKAIIQSVKKNGRCLVLTEETLQNSFTRSLAGWIQEVCFESLDAPVMCLGAENLPAIPLNTILEQTMLPNAEKVKSKMEELMRY